MRMKNEQNNIAGPIGVFDSGYGGLTILEAFRKELPQYNYIYLGDNARAPYGSRSFDVVYEFTRQAVMKLFDMGCRLIVLGCNTASAKALRTIQQHDLPLMDNSLRRVLGIIHPTVEAIGDITHTNHVGILATEGTIKSNSYALEINKLHPNIAVTGVSCPLWVPIIENNEADGEGADYFVKKRIDTIMSLDSQIDTLILGCTHYPLLLPKIKKYTPKGVQVVAQGQYVAKSLANYLQRHPNMEQLCIKQGVTQYYTTENAERFKESAKIFLHEDISVQHIDLE